MSSSVVMPIAVITGGSAGIGFELACRACENGYRPLLIARHPDALSAAADQLRTRYRIDPLLWSADLADAQERQQLIERLQTIATDIEMAVLCAGIGFGGALHENTWEAEHQVLQVNLVGLVQLSQIFCQWFAQAQRGTLLNVASLAGFQPGPYFANYYASKAYVLHFTEALALEMRPYGVQVSVLCPGTTGTGFHQKAGIDKTELARGLFGIVMTPEAVSRIALRELSRKRVVIVPGLLNQLAAWSVRWVPRSWVRAITGWMNAQPALAAVKNG
ncbi:SDR family NAD(P)-dependent oxidoreductase [Cellvibrio japonicus]|uniref:Short-chain dehydrogenase n=1 Tax=Cellvibrio japonicus (strain Ueda107) TaxID=498211 RepID=B3PIM5_CELJU|nr:SDR family oxidoreductase [Cellvibrio japonicus]ACE85310.1 short-chain dehydrogenase [Cellvibrio japonicus Ueda107]QEI13946.1 SDR family oxidoreductase [Cellvibrio japonicus]QEI17520.1 SDR family oxidoreductase [Cellvibrio japonicus]QEI21096.1 SDR family oxidoreductase [Cellvibrio japonicus]